MRKYASKKSDSQPTAAQTAAQAVSDNPGIPMSSMRSMLMQKAMNDRSHRIDLPEAMREKMERAFGMNFGKVNLYESESVDDAGASAIAQGGNIAFAPGAADFNSLDGQRRLGHELSHIASQARGEATGSGFLDNGALEARADREGALAAAGEQVYSGAAMDAPSFAGASAPMQADPPKDGEPEEEELEEDKKTVKLPPINKFNPKYMEIDRLAKTKHIPFEIAAQKLLGGQAGQRAWLKKQLSKKKKENLPEVWQQASGEDTKKKPPKRSASVLDVNPKRKFRLKLKKKPDSTEQLLEQLNALNREANTKDKENRMFQINLNKERVLNENQKKASVGRSADDEMEYKKKFVFKQLGIPRKGKNAFVEQFEEMGRADVLRVLRANRKKRDELNSMISFKKQEE